MNETLNWLAEECVNHLLVEKWLLCNDLRSGQTWKDRINLAGTTTINLHGKTIRSVVLALVSQSLAAANLTYLNNDGAQALVHDLVVAAQRAETLRYFSAVEHTESLAKLLSRSFRDMRLANVSAEGISSEAFHWPAKAEDVRQLYQAYCHALAERNLIDYAGCLERACEGMERGSNGMPTEVLILIPSELQLTFAETRFLNRLGERVQIERPDKPVATPEAARTRLAEFAKQRAGAVKYLAGYGEANEVRAVIQCVLGGKDHKPHPLDEVELLLTDPGTYVPLLYELLSAWMARRARLEGSEDKRSIEPPITFADGLACVYSRPGRALRAWLRWNRTDCVQAKAVQLVREGVLQRPDSAAEIGYARLASQLRKLRIGFGAGRYLPALESAMEQAIQLQRDWDQRREEDGTHDDEFPRDYGLPTLQALHTMLQPLLQYSPAANDSAAEVLAKARKFLLQCARSDDQLDRYARNRLLDDIEARRASLEFADESSNAILAWLEELPVESRILSSGPQPGCMHAAALHAGGLAGSITGRRLVFVMGLDAHRFPRSTAIDPVLLDDERSQLSTDLQTSSQVAQLGERVLLKTLDQVLEIDRAQLRFSFSTRNLIEGRGQSPSPSLVEIFRITENQPQAHIEDLLRHIGPPAGFASLDADQWLDPAEGIVASLLTDPSEPRCWNRIEAVHPHFHEQAVTLEQRGSVAFSHYDGWVPEAGDELSPTNPDRQVSPSLLETYGACPRRFFFRYGLSVFPPDEWNVDPERWLDPLQLGNLVHRLFEKFLRVLSKQNRIPHLHRDLPSLLELLNQEIQACQVDIPIPNRDAFQQQCELLDEMCEIFLRKEQEYCEQTGAVPWVLESSIGLSNDPQSPIDCREPVSLTLRDGRLLRIGGRIDRVDRLQKAGSEHYMIWDYKSGSNFGFSQSDPFQQGRKLQSYLYVGMLRHRLAAAGHGSDAATSFGYFFPNPKTEGLRLQWTAAELKQGDDILQHVCDLITAGIFPATTDVNDCKFCDYLKVCKEPEFVAAESLLKSLEPNNRTKLKAWRELRELDPSEAGR